MFKSYLLNKKLTSNNNQLYNLSLKKRLFFFKFIKINSLFCRNNYLFPTTSFLINTKFFYNFKKWKLLKKKYKKYNTFKFNIIRYYKQLNNFFLFKINCFLLKHNNRYILNNINIQKYFIPKLYLHLPLKNLIRLKKKPSFSKLYESFIFLKKKINWREKRRKFFNKDFTKIKIRGIKIFLKKPWRKIALNKRIRHNNRLNKNFFIKKKLKRSLRFFSFLMRRRFEIPKDEKKKLKLNIKQNLKHLHKKNTKLPQNLTNFILTKPTSNFFLKKNLFALKFIFNSYNYKTFLWRIII